MNKTLIAALSVLAFGVLVGTAVVGSYISYANYGNATEAALTAKYADNENVYANGTQKVMEVAQVPAMYTADLEKVVRAAIGGRYGEGGSKATFQWLQEQNPSLDPSMYTKIQQVIEGFREEFKVSQSSLLDKCRSYAVSRGNVWSGFWLNIAGYPKLDLNKVCTIVSTDKAAKTFETKRDTGIQLVR